MGCSLRGGLHGLWRSWGANPTSVSPCCPAISECGLRRQRTTPRSPTSKKLGERRARRVHIRASVLGLLSPIYRRASREVTRQDSCGATTPEPGGPCAGFVVFVCDASHGCRIGVPQCALIDVCGLWGVLKCSEVIPSWGANEHCVGVDHGRLSAVLPIGVRDPRTDLAGSWRVECRSEGPCSSSQEPGPGFVV